jgi:hypothetical protein
MGLSLAMKGPGGPAPSTDPSGILPEDDTPLFEGSATPQLSDISDSDNNYIDLCKSSDILLTFERHSTIWRPHYTSIK